jgi:hypothetical protein
VPKRRRQVGQFGLAPDQHGRRRQVDAGLDEFAGLTPACGGEELVPGGAAQAQRGGQQVNRCPLRPRPAALQVPQSTHAHPGLGRELLLRHPAPVPVRTQQTCEGAAGYRADGPRHGHEG